jgi:hypothetical protein
MIKADRVVACVQVRARLIEQVKFYENKSNPVCVRADTVLFSLITNGGLVEVNGDAADAIREICIREWNDEIGRIETELRQGGIEL